MEMLIRGFCAKTINRPTLMEPFTNGKFTYATDGRVIVRVPWIGAVPERDSAPDPCTQLTWTHDEVDSWLPLPTLDDSMEAKCSTCCGLGKTTTCNECHGDGVVGFFNDFHDYECECQSCNGDGVSAGGVDVCSSCGGAKYDAISVPIGAALMGSTYWRQLHSLPNAMIEATPIPRGMIRFKFDGGCGLLMTRSH